MITQRSQQNLESAFQNAVRATLVREPGDVCEIASADIGGQSPAGKLLLITLSAFAFKLMIIFRIAEARAALSYFSPTSTAHTLEEVLAEVVNMCGGTLKHALSAGFPHLALSTPCTLSGECIAFLNEMRPQYLVSYQITINSAVTLQATLCLCCSAPLEVADSAATVEADPTVGELEIF